MTNYAVEQIAFSLKQAELWTSYIGGMPKVQDRRADILPLEKQVWRNTAERHEVVSAA